MKTEFELTAHSPILIYGAGTFGQNIYEKIKKIYNVKGFIDRNVKKIDGVDIPVNNLQYFSEHKNCTVIVCVHNGNWHYEIAENLWACGFEKIVFLALADTYRQKNAVRMNRIYNLLLEEQYSDLSNIPYYREIRKKTNEEKIIRQNSDFVVTWCKKNWLYTYNRSLKKNEEISKLNFKAYFDVPMIAQRMYVSLFRFFMYGTGSADLYIKTMKERNNSFEMSEEDFFQEQYAVYQLLEREYEKGIEAISNMPIDVRWNSRGYFNIIDGHHRCIFYWLKGMQSMPVRMKREDYNIWLNSIWQKKVQKLLKEKNLLSAVQLNHPILQECGYRYEEYEITVLDTLMEWIYSVEEDFHTILEISDYQAYYGRNLYRMNKAEKVTSIVEKKQDIELSNAICALEYVPSDAVEIMDSVRSATGEGRMYELTLLCGVYGINELKEKLTDVDRSVKRALFWQSQTDIEEEKQYIISHSNFSNYCYLATKCIRGRRCEVGVFSK